MPVQLAARRKAVVHQLLHHRFRVGQRHQAVADVPRRLDAQLLPQPPRTAAVVGHGHNGGDVGGVGLDAANQAGQAAAAADDGDARASAQHPVDIHRFEDAGMAGPPFHLPHRPLQAIAGRPGRQQPQADEHRPAQPGRGGVQRNHAHRRNNLPGRGNVQGEQHAESDDEQPGGGGQQPPFQRNPRHQEEDERMAAQAFRQRFAAVLHHYRRRFQRFRRGRFRQWRRGRRRRFGGGSGGVEFRSHQPGPGVGRRLILGGRGDAGVPGRGLFVGVGRPEQRRFGKGRRPQLQADG